MESDVSSARSGDANPQDLLGGIATNRTGRFARTIEAALGGITADRDFPIAYDNLATAYFFSDRFAEAERTLERASARNLDMPLCLVLRYNIAAPKRDVQQMNAAVSMAKANGLPKHRMTDEEALALARSGRLESARRSSKRAVELAL